MIDYIYQSLTALCLCTLFTPSRVTTNVSLRLSSLLYMSTSLVSYGEAKGGYAN